MSPPLTRTGRPNTSGSKGGLGQSRPLPAPPPQDYDPQQEAQFRGVLQSQLDEIRRFMASLILVKTNYIWIDRNSINQTGIAQATSTKVQFNRKNLDGDGVFDATTNFRYTPNVGGKFLISGALTTSSAASNLIRAFASIFKNGSEIFRTMDLTIANAAGLTNVNTPFSAIVDMNGTTDYLEIFAFIQSNGGLADGIVGGAPGNTYLTAQRIGL